MSLSTMRRRWYRPWKVEYFWWSSAYGCILGWAWTRRGARRRLDRSIIEMTDQ